ncbi:Signal peptidase complex catalytic subunit [Clydaea vesicula]|uniref:Signal peptidase complex catalytic subunit SEC11 n=1 Tax=Clydaea vesicula TaxID=447962 RepID=A0AAD5TT24_9FUNG|nr:Signal peptidase complex catalytic subunit [Clydaea vesicula]
MGCGAVMTFKLGSLITNTESPIVVVISESMEPAFARGDLLALWFDKSPVVIGDIPIVHRVTEIHINKKTGKQYILTKGDNNGPDDRGLYTQYKHYDNWLHEDHIIGKVKGHFPFLGYITIIFSEQPKLKYLVFGIMIISTLLWENKEEN